MTLPVPSSDLVGVVLGSRYRVMQRIGIGGFGAVYQAEHVMTRRNFAIKVLLPEFSERPKFAERFVREATTTARIEHENVVDIIDVGRTDQGHLYFAMELLRGETFERTLARDGRLSWQRARVITLQICDGLRAAHDRGIIHRDLKPANIYRVTRGGNPDFIKILDFGIAKLLAPEDQKEGKGLTSHYEVLGTPLYMSPEQTAADPVDRRSDIYSVGVMLFEMLTGERPYAGESHVELMSKILLGEVPQMAEVAPYIEIPPAFQMIVSKAMARKPAQRYHDMNAMMAALQSLDDRGRFSRDSGSATAVEPASEDTMLASIPKGDIARTLIRPPMPVGSPGHVRTLLAAALIVVGIVTVMAAVLATHGAGPVEQTLPPSVERVPLPLTPENRVIVAPDQMPPIPSFIVEAPPPPPRPARPAPSCEAALASSLAGLPPATVRKCIASTGVTSGDRTTVQLGGSAGGKLEVKTLESSGSREFDACLARALGQRHLPADATPGRCQKALLYRVP